ncbi:hypothetical protein COCON_G00002580 [Conger conger]|uniref:Protoporphyrinogen oxidase n=1 Tax=Conger conger TaxID=82655 RepID=A0A9Q1E0Z3_CONCO|nr:protoporphyrinogen oxidase [Conger conger]XP_061096594.1 protoporphyrinogen oxidase [Conger conger]XP_061096604.1 protoporphyrinogen oxidase [Conger conger]KAJ8287599.1 hypothetical protein COCON_G00002580 [Conger conger]
MQKTVAVLGGGIGGLTACYHLSKSPQVSKMVLLEGSGRLGGWLNSTRREDGAVFERGPRGVRHVGAVGRNTLNMVSELGLESELLIVSQQNLASKNRFLYVGGQLHAMPTGLGGVMRTTPPFSRPLALSGLQDLLAPRGPEEDETVHSFVTRRLGKELADLAVDCLCRGVFAGDCRALSVRSCFPPLFNLERARRSLFLGMLFGAGGDTGTDVPPPPSALARRSQEEKWAQWSLRRGMQALPEALGESLSRGGRVQIHTQAPVRRLELRAGGWEITLPDGTVTADHVISALPAHALASALPPTAQPLSDQLRQIAMVTVAVVNLEYEGSVLPVPGFGHLIPSSEDRGVLGVVYDSVAFPQHNRPGASTTRLTVMMGGAWFQEVFGNAEDVTERCIVDRATQAVRAQLGVSAEPLWSSAAVLKDCIPQYHVGHWKRLENIRHYISHHNLPLTLVGASYDGVSVNDVIFGGRKAAESLVGGA